MMAADPARVGIVQEQGGVKNVAAVAAAVVIDTRLSTTYYAATQLYRFFSLVARLLFIVQ